MALRAKSIDEETTELADVYDSLIAPKKIWRNHNNKLYLVLRAYAAGKVGITDAALALRGRFDPRYCDDADLYSTAKLVGTDFKRGTGSILDITIRNRDITESKILKGGVYRYQSASGMVFSFDAANDYEFAPLEEKTVSAISAEKGRYAVAANNDIKPWREDGAGIDGAFSFSCEDNTGQLGYEDESAFEFRTRILNDADRQDHIKELELAIRNLPNIFECNLKLNAGTAPVEYDGHLLQPRELLVVITGVPTNDIAKLVAGAVCYATHKVSDEQAVYYENPLYVGGKYPVYYAYHERTGFSLAVTYRYDKTKLKATQVEDAIRALFAPYTRTVRHIDTFGEKDAYDALAGLDLPNVRVLDANVIDADGREVPYVVIPATRLPRLTGITFTAVETEEAA